MPGKNKPKRLNRHRSWRVARRKKRRREVANPVKRSRAKRPKKKGSASSIPITAQSTHKESRVTDEVKKDVKKALKKVSKK